MVGNPIPPNTKHDVEIPWNSLVNHGFSEGCLVLGDIRGMGLLSQNHESSDWISRHVAWGVITGGPGFKHPQRHGAVTPDGARWASLPLEIYISNVNQTDTLMETNNYRKLPQITEIICRLTCQAHLVYPKFINHEWEKSGDDSRKIVSYGFIWFHCNGFKIQLGRWLTRSWHPSQLWSVVQILKCHTISTCTMIWYDLLWSTRTSCNVWLD